jgi:nicotinamide phosphoribosyltransferase
MTNLILNTDSYKASHWGQYPAGTENVFSYIESRGGIFDRTVVFGPQMFVKNTLMKGITVDDVAEAKEMWGGHGEPFNEAGWLDIATRLGGKLPLMIKAVPEGTVLPTHHAMVTVEATDPKHFWLVSYIETALLRAVWYPTTVATLSWHIKQLIKTAIEKTSDVPEQIAFKLHDFGARGVSSEETAGIGGAAHLVNFMGTDTMSGIVTAKRFYHEPMAGFSIPAAEHSTMTSWERDHEVDAYANMIDLYGKPGGMFAVVSDSYDFWHAVSSIWGEQLKQRVIDSGATLVVRPDSGDPTVVPVKAVQLLAEKFGYTVNSKGYKVLPSCVRVIQGDGITLDSIKVIIKNLTDAGFAIDNLAFGMGGGLGQMVNRDTLKFAQKASAAKVNGVWRDVYKDPVTDHGKRSKRGRLALVRDRGHWETVREEDRVGVDYLEPIFCNGEMLRDQTFADIRERSNTALD